MIANEMNRARKLMQPTQRSSLESCYERVLRLTDLTIRTRDRRALRRELLRWRDLVAELYLSPSSNPTQHDATSRCLLRFTAAASEQISLLLGAGSGKETRVLTRRGN